MRDASDKVDFLVDIMRDKHEGETIMREIIKILALRARTPRTHWTWLQLLHDLQNYPNEVRLLLFEFATSV